MLKIGEMNQLTIMRKTLVGYFLADEEGDEVLLPNKYTNPNAMEDDKVDVFVYKDSEDRVVATNLVPKIKLNDFALLNIRDVSNVGAFADWGLEKDLLIPFKEQNRKMVVGRKYVVYMYLDQQTQRLVGSCKINRFLTLENVDLKEKQEVELMVYSITDLGATVIVNKQYRGLIFSGDIFRKIAEGDQLKGYVKGVREDGKVDIVLQLPGFAAVEPGAQIIIDMLENNGGRLPLTDSSSPESIYDTLKMSKKIFKKAIGTLYKKQLIDITENGIILTSKNTGD